MDATLITYYVDEVLNQLMAVIYDRKASESGQRVSQPVVIADNIEDLQLYYFFNNEEVDNNKVYLDPGLNTAKLNNYNVQAVTIGLTAKSAYNRGRAGFTRPALFNRTNGTQKDSFARLSILETVKLRNFQP
jgi:hypothetical protein